jgi:hypothetical protein
MQIKSLTCAVLTAAALWGAPSLAANNSASADAWKPMTPEERSLMRYWIRKDLLGSLLRGCAHSHPNQGEAYQALFRAWEDRQQDRFEAAAKLMLKRNSKQDADELSDLLEPEVRWLKAWVTNDLGISTKQEPSAEECLKIAHALPLEL